MTTQLNLQRDTEIFFSTIDLAGGDSVNKMYPANTWRVDVLAGYSISQTLTAVDVAILEMGMFGDRSTSRFRNSIDPVEWGFSTYLRPTGIETHSDDTSGRVTPIADWFLWQGLLSNTSISDEITSTIYLDFETPEYDSQLVTSASPISAWQPGGKFELIERSSNSNTSSHTSNFESATEYHIYLKMDNVVYQVQEAVVNELSLDAAVDGIATCNWTGFGLDLKELTGGLRDDFISVSGGTLNNGTVVAANASSVANTQSRHYHEWATYENTESSFIVNRLSDITLTHTPAQSAKDSYTFSTTALDFSYNNNIAYLIPEEIGRLNRPFAQSTGSRTITGSFSSYLRNMPGGTSQFVRRIANDPRTNIADYCSANIKVGGSSAPFVSLFMPATHFNFPTHSVDEIVSIGSEFLAQESNANVTLGDELTVIVKK